jgi:hypothetical protein
MSRRALSPTTASARPTQTAKGVTEHFASDQVAPVPLILTDGTEDDVSTPPARPSKR